MTMRWKMMLAVGAMALLPLQATAQGMDDVEIETTDLGGGIYMLNGRGGNLGVSVGSDGIILVDDQFAPLTDKIKAALAQISDQPVRFLINTHWHGDHTGGNENWGEAGTAIVAQDNVYERMSMEQVGQLSGRTTPASPAAALPILTFDNEVSFHMNGDTAHAYHVPHAHTDGDSMIYFSEANVLHMGDIFFNGMYPYIDVDSGGGIDGMLAGVARALEIVNDDTKIIPGHGPLANRADLAAYGDVIRTIRNRVAQMKSAGSSLDEIIAAGISAEYDAQWGWSFINAERLITTIYHTL
jgi:cyclase